MGVSLIHVCNDIFITLIFLYYHDYQRFMSQFFIALFPDLYIDTKKECYRTLDYKRLEYFCLFFTECV